jgi:hypothetical protein
VVAICTRKFNAKNIVIFATRLNIFVCSVLFLPISIISVYSIRQFLTVRLNLIEEDMSVFSDVIVLVIVGKTVYMNTCNSECLPI